MGEDSVLPPLEWSSLRVGFDHDVRTAMAGAYYTGAEIVSKLRQVDVLTAQGRPGADAIGVIGPGDRGGRKLCITAGGNAGPII